MKRILFALFAIAVLFSQALPAAAAGKGSPPPVFALNGTLNSADANAKTLSVHVAHGSRAVQSYIGKDLTVATDANTKFYLISSSGRKQITLADLLPGDTLNIAGKVQTDGSFLAVRVLVVRPPAK